MDLHIILLKTLIPWVYVVSHCSYQLWSGVKTMLSYHSSHTLHSLTCIHKRAHTHVSQEYRKCILSRDSNQKLGVCHALLEMGDWQVASRLMALLPPFLPTWAPYITASLCQMIHLLIEPLYRKYVVDIPYFLSAQ